MHSIHKIHVSRVKLVRTWWMFVCVWTNMNIESPLLKRRTVLKAFPIY